jgi:hypothetical protein
LSRGQETRRDDVGGVGVVTADRAGNGTAYEVLGVIEVAYLKCFEVFYKCFSNDSIVH